MNERIVLGQNSGQRRLIDAQVDGLEFRIIEARRVQSDAGDCFDALVCA